MGVRAGGGGQGGTGSPRFIAGRATGGHTACRSITPYNESPLSIKSQDIDWLMNSVQLAKKYK